MTPFLRTAAAATMVAGLLTAGGQPAAAGYPPARVSNPYEAAQVYVNPEWSANAAGELGGSAVADQPTAVWLDRIAAIPGEPGEMGLRDHLDEALAQGADVIQLVLYNLPGRDCNRRVSEGELALDELDRYRDEFIDPIIEILADPAYASLRIVTIVEPNSLPNLVTHGLPGRNGTIACTLALESGAYVASIGYALAQLATIPNVYAYLDISHHAQLGWTENAVPAAELIRLAATSAGSTVHAVHGLISNTANYSVVREEFFSADDIVGGRSVREASPWIDFNPFVDELPYLLGFRARLGMLGFDSDLSLLIDTSRNGWGGPARPTATSRSNDPVIYVEESRIDRRITKSNWCNQVNAGLGERPVANPEPGIDAFVWAKPPGESDGSHQPLGGLPGEPMCDPDYLEPIADPDPTEAMPGAPPQGEWFPAHFRRLLEYAWPPL
ncbi:MAG TPA: glycoside hydrolase family 6 protein [Natronosporangium sp.]